MATYKIIAKTNGWIAQRDPMFEGKTEVVLFEQLSLKNAQKALLDLFNSLNEDRLPHAINWGMAVILSRGKVDSAMPTLNDGTRMFDYDSRRFLIED